MVYDIIGYSILAILVCGAIIGAYRQHKPIFTDTSLNRIDRLIWTLSTTAVGIFGLTLIMFLSRITWLSEEVGATTPAVWMYYTGIPALLLTTIRQLFAHFFRHKKRQAV